ncbi:hypothetical protein B0H15DRAFT_800612 [Mycena belliarum]|uniref:Uncharacterized protein n=1 Tax=Mycena belliarum TaxID=1033014 RepID=A0AAD6XMN5_9AGAR|nr:hypothetical protein B0H15DRAFT_800612 [Mycena belliae]
MTSEPALDLLWTKLTRPSQIIDLLPEDAYELVEPRNYNLKRPLVESDFAVFDKYAPRVQFVDLSTLKLTLTPGCELFSTLKTFRDPIFPRLLRFDWYPTERYNTGAFHSINTMGAFHLISRKFNVPKEQFCLTMSGGVTTSAAVTQIPPDFATGDGLIETINSFRESLSSWLPDVQSLVIRTGNYFSIPDILAALRGLSDLQHFQKKSSQLRLGTDILSHLAGLPHLKTLHIEKETERTIADLAEVLEKRHRPSFPSLQSVKFDGTYHQHSVFLRLITSKSLESIHMNLTGLHPVDKSIFSPLTTPPIRLSSLRHFIFIMRHIGDCPHPILSAMTMFEPLLACANLETFDIFFEALKVEFGDNDLQRMADAWPKLVSLKVFSRHTQQTEWADPEVHLYTLWTLVEKCRHLYELEMPVDARVDGPFVPPHGVLPGLPTLKTMCLFLSPCGSPTYIADFLNLAFPNLVQLDASTPRLDSENHEQTWNKVRDALPNVVLPSNVRVRICH